MGDTMAAAADRSRNNPEPRITEVNNTSNLRAAKTLSTEPSLDGFPTET